MFQDRQERLLLDCFFAQGDQYLSTCSGMQLVCMLSCINGSPSQVDLPRSLLNINYCQTPLLAFCSLEKEREILKKKKNQPRTKKDWQLQSNLVIKGTCHENNACIITRKLAC